MSFWSSTAGYVITAILSAIGGWLLKLIHLYIQDRQQSADEAARAAQVTKELQDAQTAAELEKAAQDAANNFGR